MWRKPLANVNKIEEKKSPVKKAIYYTQVIKSCFVKNYYYKPYFDLCTYQQD